MGKSSKSIWLLCLLINVYGQALWAGVDAQAGLGARSYPKSGSIDLEIGIYSILWGSFDPQFSDSEPWYGFIRGFAKPSASLNYDAFEWGIEVFPVSIFGFRYANEQSNNRDDLDAYNCVLYDCIFADETRKAEADLTLGFSNLFFGARLGLQSYYERQNENSTLPTIDPTTGLTWVPVEDDEVRYVNWFLGMSVSDQWQVMALHNRYKVKRTEDESISSYLFANRKIGKFSVGIGAGVFKSEIKAEEFSGILRLKWEPLKSPTLF